MNDTEKFDIEKRTVKVLLSVIEGPCEETLNRLSAARLLLEAVHASPRPVLIEEINDEAN